MDNNVNVVNQNPPPAVPADQANQSQPQAVVQPVYEPSMPMGSVNKEAGPVVSPVPESASPTDTEPQISAELKDLGVETKSEKPELTPEHKELGVDHVGSNITVSVHAPASVKLPMTEEEIADRLKTGQDDDSGKWLAGLIQKIVRVIGL